MDKNTLNHREERQGVRRFFFDLLAGFAIGIAFIIPGFSGGSIAAILGIYERLIDAIVGIFRNFKNSFKTLLPIGIGLVLGAVSLLFPLKAALNLAPLPTVALFVGLALGGIFSITDKVKGKFTLPGAFSISLSLIAAAALIFIPVGADVNLFEVSPFGYITLMLIGLFAASALVIPGISGSMLLLILGYYNPIIEVITDHFLKGKDLGRSILILGSVGVGIVAGFFLISLIMKRLLKKHPRLTYLAIIGFILGSIPSAFVSTAKEAGYTAATLPTSPLHWIFVVVLLLVGFVSSLLFIIKVKKILKNSETE